MLRYQIKVNGDTICDVAVEESDQLEATLVKVIGSFEPVLSVTAFTPSSSEPNEFMSIEQHILRAGDVFTLEIEEVQREGGAYFEVPEDLDDSEDECGLVCSFCSKTSHEVKNIVAGNDVFICDECIQLCSDIVNDEKI